MALASCPARHGQQRSLRRICQVLSWALARWRVGRARAAGRGPGLACKSHQLRRVSGPYAAEVHRQFDAYALYMKRDVTLILLARLTGAWCFSSHPSVSTLWRDCLAISSVTCGSRSQRGG
jgi:hypothetical protein